MVLSVLGPKKVCKVLITKKIKCLTKGLTYAILDRRDIGMAKQRYFHCRKCSAPVLEQMDWLLDGIEYSSKNLEENPLLFESAKIHSKIPAVRILLSKKDGGAFSGRLLVCQHFIPASQESIPLIRNDDNNPSIQFLVSNENLFPLTLAGIVSEEELREVRVNLMPIILHMTPEQLFIHIQEHFEDYRNHLKAYKKEKYAIQLIQDELERRAQRFECISCLKAFESVEKKAICPFCNSTNVKSTLLDSTRIDYEYLFTKSPRGAEKLAREKVKVDNSVAKKAKSEEDALKLMLVAMQRKGKNITMEELKERLKGN